MTFSTLSLRTALLPSLIAGVAVVAVFAPAISHAGIVIPNWQPSVHSNQNPGTPTGVGTVDGNAIEMWVAGGGAGTHSNYLRLFSQTSSELSFPEAGQSIRFSVSGLSFETLPVDAAGSDQVLYFTLATAPDAVPFKSETAGMQQAIALSITAAGAYSLGWANAGASEAGWISDINSSGSKGVSVNAITGFDLVLSQNSYDLTLYTTGDSIELSGVHGLGGNEWGDLGVSLTLKKMFGAGDGGNRLTAHIDHLELSAIPEPQSAAMLVGGAALIWAGARRLKVARSSSNGGRE